MIYGIIKGVLMFIRKVILVEQWNQIFEYYGLEIDDRGRQWLYIDEIFKNFGYVGYNQNVLLYNFFE